MDKIEIPSQMRVELSTVETEFCDLLKKFNSHLKDSDKQSNTCRIAGGWVRDKLLGLQSNDIDIALSDVMGLPFAEGFKDFAENIGVNASKVAVIKKNPDQSKHLEPATLRIMDMDIDFVNLRNEEYASESRIPTTVSFGTPLEDALRRDITINSLFYNIHTGEVEDFTGQGLEDLKNGIIRTPLPPRETFQDDPLRVLRCIRFAGRFGFSLVSPVKEAILDPAIQQALVSKVKRPRVGEEVSKMLKGRDPFGSIQLIHELSLYNSIFACIPEEFTSNFSSPLPSPSKALTAASILQALVHPALSSELALHPTLLSTLHADSSCEARLFLAAILSPYIGITYQDKKNKTFPAVGCALDHSLKLGRQYHFSDGVPALFVASQILNNPELTKFKDRPERVAIGMMLREKAVHNADTGSHWTSSLLFSLVQELVPLQDASGTMDVETSTKVIQTYNAFVARVEELGLSDVADARPLLNGGEVAKQLDRKPGPWTGQVLNQVMEWQLTHPEGTKASCEKWLQEACGSGKLDIPETSSEPAAKRPRTK
ncbi:hypothetical protein C8J56DRAFT_1041030 [Mycena floridula]|nr:hypothetical protein C8J56DRAFT_1041030 [Mycena floridula]